MDAKPTPTFLVDPSSEPVLVRIDGRASFQNCAPLKDFFVQMMDAGKRRYVLDFARCTSMDSTFLGVIVGAALKLRKASPPGGLTLVRLGARNLELVRNLGLHRLVTVDAEGGPVESGRAMAGALPAAGEVGELESARLVLEAHENLVEADDSNAVKFQDVIAFLKNRMEQG